MWSREQVVVRVLGTAAAADLEVEVIHSVLGVAGVADVADELALANVVSALEPRRIRDAALTTAGILASPGEVVVEVDIDVRVAAGPLQVEHAGAERRAGVQLHPAALGGDRGRTPARHDVVALVPAAGTRRSVIVREGDVAHDREGEPRHGGARGRAEHAQQ
jgi:hypothetical protein